MVQAKKGFSYSVSQEQVSDYRTWPVERKLNWLLLGNKMRKVLPFETIAIQEKFREGKI